jgi:hypothetical protein
MWSRREPGDDNLHSAPPGVSLFEEMPMLPTPARTVRAAIKTQLEIEPQCAVARPDGFEWWPGYLAQLIWVEDGDWPLIYDSPRRATGARDVIGACLE